MTDADVAAAHHLAGASLDDMVVRTLPATRPQPDYPALDDPGRTAAGHHRMCDALATDPDGCWVAEDADGLAGVAIALRRGGFWLLSLLAVRLGVQGTGIGRELLDAALRTREGATTGLILASQDPRALRRYQTAGFRPHPSYEAEGKVDRTALPAASDVGHVRDADLDRDVEPLHDLVRRLRGAPPGPELAELAERPGRRLLVTDEPARGFVLLRDGSPMWLAADDEDTARRLLWAGLAEGTGTVTVGWLTARQQWAIDVCLRARLELWAGPSVCHWGEDAPFAPYLPSGAYG
jgi:GNAT superfamily N-acetyltransferase